MKRRYKRKRSGWMRRTSRIYLNKTVNKSKLDTLKEEIKKGGRRRKSWHHYIETEANRYLKQLNLDGIKLISLESLKHVKRGKRGKFSRIAEESGFCV